MFTTIILSLAIIIYGTFYETTSALISIILTIFLINYLMKNHVLYIKKSVFSFGIIILPLAALISIPFSIDYGMAILGFIKMLPAALFTIAISGIEIEQKEKALNVIPIVTAVITLIGLLSRFTPYMDFFYIQNRFSGVFQYANSYALLLLISIVIVLYSDWNMWKRILLSIFFLYAIWETGSRSVGVLAVICIAVWIFSFEGRKKYFVLIIPVAFLILISSNILSGRWVDFDLLSSSFVSRLFYNYDGMRAVITHPLGLGYKGFLFYQGSIQTANYSTIFAHNELLQTALDYGWIPAVILAIGGFKILFKKEISKRNRSILAVIIVHSLFDWDLQFMALLMIMILVADLDTDECKEFDVSGFRIKAAAIIGSIVIAINIWLGIATYFEYNTNYSAASKIYPGLTTSQMNMINNTGFAERHELAESICSRNDYCVIALQAMAENALYEGNIADAEKYAWMSMKAGRYNSTGYEFYIQIMNSALDMVAETGDENNLYAVIMHINKVPDLIDDVRSTTSPYADLLYNKPYIKLDEQYITYLEEVKNLIKGGQNETN